MSDWTIEEHATASPDGDPATVIYVRDGQRRQVCTLVAIDAHESQYRLSLAECRAAARMLVEAASERAQVPA